MRSEPEKWDDVTLSLSSLERIDRICRAFESAWKKGERPRLEDYLREAQGNEKTQLERELRALDRHYSGSEQRETFGLELPLTLAERYRVTEKLGEGGMGVVLAGIDTKVGNRPVAIKLIRRSLLDSRYFRYFSDEIRTLAGMRHEGIVRIYDTGALDDKVPYFVMERLDGLPLDRFVTERQPSVESRLRLLIEVLEAVHYMHDQGLLHRDLKPANLFVTGPDHRGRFAAIVVDFGLAIDYNALRKRNDGGPRAIVGTPAYLSPDQLRLSPGDLDRRSDVYALGLVLYFLLTERLPYRVTATDYESLVEQVCNSPIAPPQIHQEEIPDDLQAIVLKALARDRGARYRDAATLADHLRIYLDRRPVPLIKNPLYVVRKLFRRHAIVSVCVAILLVLVTAFVIRQVRWGREVGAFDRYQQEIVTAMNVGDYRVVEGIIDRAKAEFSDSLERRVILNGYRNWLKLELLQDVHGVPGVRYLSEAAPTPLGAAERTGRWRRPDEAREIEARLEELELASPLEPPVPPTEDPMPTIHMAGILGNLDQYSRAETLLEEVPEASRELWHYRYVRCLLRIREAVGDSDNQSELEAGQRELEALFIASDSSPELSRIAPEVLYNRFHVLMRLGRTTEAKQVLSAALGHAETSQALRSLLEQEQKRIAAASRSTRLASGGEARQPERSSEPDAMAEGAQAAGERSAERREPRRTSGVVGGRSVERREPRRTSGVTYRPQPEAQTISDAAWTDVFRPTQGRAILAALPADTTLVVHVPDMKNLARKIRESPLGNVADLPAVSPLLTRMKDSLKTVCDMVRSEVGVDLRDSLSTAAGELVVAYGSVRPLEKPLTDQLSGLAPKVSSEAISILVSVDVESSEGWLNAALDAFVKLAGGKGARIDPTERFGSRIVTVRPPFAEGDEWPQALHFATHGTTFLVALNRKLLEQVLQNVASGRPGGLSEDSRFQATFKLCGNGADVFGFVNLGSLTRSIANGLNATFFGIFWQKFHALVFGNSLDNLGMGIGIDQNGIRQRMFLHNAGAGDGILGWWWAPSIAGRPPALVPDNADMAGSVSIDATKIFTFFQELAETMMSFQGGGDVNMMFEQQFGVKLDGLKTAFGTRVDVFSVADADTDHPFGAVTLLVGLEDASSLRKLLDRINRMMGPGTCATEEYQGHEINTFVDREQLRLALCITDESLILSGETENVRRALRRLKNTASPVASRPSFETAAARFPGQVSFFGYQTAAYTKEVAAMSADLIVPIDAGLRATGAENPADVTKALSSVIRAFLGSFGDAFGWGAWMPEGFFVECRASFR